MIQTGFFIEELFADLIYVKNTYETYQTNKNIATERYANNSIKNLSITNIKKLTHAINLETIKENIYRSTDNAIILSLFSKLLDSTRSIGIFDQDLSKTSHEITAKLNIDEKSAIAEYFGIPFNRNHNTSIQTIFCLLIESIEFSILASCIILEKLYTEKHSEIKCYESSNFKKLPKLVNPNPDSIKKHQYFPKFDKYKILEKYNSVFGN